jgi:hypothetical protein
MADTEKPTIDAASDKKPPHWWWHDDEYVARDTWNWLALLEIAIAFGIYYFLLIPFTTWPWVTVISFLSVPMLLLRSENSILRGVELLENEWSIKDPSKYEVFGFMFLVLAGISTWKLVISTFADLSIWGNLAIGITVLLALLSATGARLSIVLSPFVISGSIKKNTKIEKLTKVDMLSTSAVLLIFILPALLVIMLSSCVRSVWNRFRATCTWPNIKAGVKNFNHNWHETVLVSNMRHAPALIPRAGLVNKNLNAATLKIDFGEHFRIVNSTISLSLKFVIFVVAAVYRWNIKANGWIWGAIAFGLRDSVWLPSHDAKKRKRAAVLTSLITIGAVVSLWLFLALIWIKAIATNSVFAVFNKLQGTFFADIAEFALIIPTHSLLFYALTLLTLSLFALISLATFAHIAHHAVFSNAADWEAETNKSEVHRMEARRDASLVAIALNWNLVIAYFFVCTTFFMAFSYFRADLMPAFDNKAVWNFVASPQFMQELMK